MKHSNYFEEFKNEVLPKVNMAFGRVYVVFDCVMRPSAAWDKKDLGTCPVCHKAHRIYEVPASEEDLEKFWVENFD